MEIKILMTFNDNERKIYLKKNYHKEKLGIPFGFGITLLDKTDKKIKYCYPISSSDRKNCSIAFTHMDTKIICKCSFFEGEKQLVFHNGKTVLKIEYASILNQLSLYIRDLYQQHIHNSLDVQEYCKFNVIWNNNKLIQSNEIKFGPIEYVVKELITVNKTIVLNQIA